MSYSLVLIHLCALLCLLETNFRLKSPKITDTKPLNLAGTAWNSHGFCLIRWVRCHTSNNICREWMKMMVRACSWIICCLNRFESKYSTVDDRNFKCVAGVCMVLCKQIVNRGLGKLPDIQWGISIFTQTSQLHTLASGPPSPQQTLLPQSAASDRSRCDEIIQSLYSSPG
jgi:hypothetical protein